MKRRSPIFRVGFLAVVLAVVLAGLQVTAASAEELTLVITSPPPGEPLFGETHLAAELHGRLAEDILRVDFFVDDRFVGAATEPPWQLDWNLGEHNIQHRIEIVAEARDGARSSALLISPRIEVDLELDAGLQQLYVTVERKGERVKDLRREDFTILDDGRPQRLVTFERGDVPLTASLLLDASDSMRGNRLRAALAGASAFLDGMQPLDQAQLILFSDRVLHETPFTNVAEVLEVGLSSVTAEGGTALVDNLYRALHGLAAVQGRRVLILLSDGVDVASLLRMDEVLESLRRSQTQIYWLRLGGDDPTRLAYSAWHDAKEHRNQLEQLAKAVSLSGGRIVDLDSTAAAGDAFRRILQELRDQYVLGYYPTDDQGDGAWHRLKVTSTQRGLDVRTREGYVDR